jgi:hypothetical protein
VIMTYTNATQGNSPYSATVGVRLQPRRKTLALNDPSSQEVASKTDSKLNRFHLCHHAHLLSSDGMRQYTDIIPRSGSMSTQRTMEVRLGSEATRSPSIHQLANLQAWS